MNPPSRSFQTRALFFWMTWASLGAEMIAPALKSYPQSHLAVFGGLMSLQFGQSIPKYYTCGPRGSCRIKPT